MAASWQEHAGAAVTSGGSQSPNVQYAYEDGASGGVAQYVRLDYVTYPAGRVVYYNYPSSGIGAALSRLDNIADSGTPGDSNKYVDYAYMGVNSIVTTEYHKITRNGYPLTLNYGTDGGTGLDRFGRVIDHTWKIPQGLLKSPDYFVDRYRYGYDRSSSRIWRENVLTTLKDEYYAYDGLDRLESYSRGDLTGTYPSYTGINTSTDVRREAWGLSQTGVWLDYQIDANADDDWTDAGVKGDRLLFY